MTTLQTQTELVFLAKDTVEVIRETKQAFWRALLSLSGAFAFIYLHRDISPLLNAVFLAGAALTYLLCIYIYPGALAKRRKRLHSLYEHFTPQFKNTHGDLKNLTKPSWDELLLNDAARIYILLLAGVFAYAWLS